MRGEGDRRREGVGWRRGEREEREGEGGREGEREGEGRDERGGRGASKRALSWTRTCAN